MGDGVGRELISMPSFGAGSGVDSGGVLLSVAAAGPGVAGAMPSAVTVRHADWNRTQES